MDHATQSQPTLDEHQAERLYRDKIIRTLNVYPEISSSMLHIGVGPSTPSVFWKPILEKLIEEGVVQRTLRVYEGKSYQVISLVKHASDMPPAVPHTLKNV